MPSVYKQAYKKKMLYPGYVWITYGWYYDNHWWKTESKCTVEEIGAVLKGAIALSHYPPLHEDDSSFNSNTVSLLLLCYVHAPWHI